MSSSSSRYNDYKITNVVIKAGFSRLSNDLKRIHTNGTMARASFELRASCDRCRKYTSMRFQPQTWLDNGVRTDHGHGIRTPIPCHFIHKCSGCYHGDAFVRLESVMDADFDYRNGDIHDGGTRAVKRKEVLRLQVMTHLVKFVTNNVEANTGTLTSCVWTITFPDWSEVVREIDIDGIRMDTWHVGQVQLFPSLLTD